MGRRRRPGDAFADLSGGVAAADGFDLQRLVGRRPLPDSQVACAAPFVTMEFGAYGVVQACCANAMYPIGDVRHQTIEEIWHGPRAEQLRASLRAADLSTGCGVCRFRLRHTPGELPRDYYDQFGFVGGGTPEWPKVLSFSLHNTCNLACVMCGGDESSRIRSTRDGLPPLPHAYGDRFFEELAPFLEHCDFADFVGGEPFLVREHQRVWDMLIAQDHPVRCSVATNGTVWNERVERVLDQLDFQVTVSVDGITPETFERIRVGASHEEVFRNIERFHRYTRERGRPFAITWSLVRQNWFELGSMLAWAEERGIPVRVQTVMEPEFGVQAVATDQLRDIVDSLEREDAVLRPVLELNLDMWDRELRRLRDELRLRDRPDPELRVMRGPEFDNAPHVMASILAAPEATESTDSVVAALLDPWLEPGRERIEFQLDRSGTIITVGDLAGMVPDGALPTGVGVGQRFDRFLHSMSERFGGGIWLMEEFRSSGLVEHLVFLGHTFRDKSGLVLRIVSHSANDGTVTAHVAISFALTGSSEASAAPESAGDGNPVRVVISRLRRRRAGRG